MPPRAPSPRREVHATDAIAWMEARGVIAGASVVTSLPDVSELPGMPLAAWRTWFARAATLAQGLCADDGVTVFCQTDVVAAGEWIDKGHLLSAAMDACGARLVWQRIVCRQPPGSQATGRPAFSRLLCFSRARPLPALTPRVDVVPDGGEPTWSRGMGLRTCLEACRYVVARTPSRVIVDPFCGEGMVLAVANALGLDAIGVEVARRRARAARSLVVSLPTDEPG